MTFNTLSTDDNNINLFKFFGLNEVKNASLVNTSWYRAVKIFVNYKNEYYFKFVDHFQAKLIECALDEEAKGFYQQFGREKRQICQNVPQLQILTNKIKNYITATFYLNWNLPLFKQTVNEWLGQEGYANVDQEQMADVEMSDATIYGEYALPTYEEPIPPLELPNNDDFQPTDLANDPAKLEHVITHLDTPSCKQSLANYLSYLIENKKSQDFFSIIPEIPLQHLDLLPLCVFALSGTISAFRVMDQIPDNQHAILAECVHQWLQGIRGRSKSASASFTPEMVSRFMPEWSSKYQSYDGKNLHTVSEKITKLLPVFVKCLAACKERMKSKGDNELIVDFLFCLNALSWQIKLGSLGFYTPIGNLAFKPFMQNLLKQSRDEAFDFLRMLSQGNSKQKMHWILECKKHIAQDYLDKQEYLLALTFLIKEDMNVYNWQMEEAASGLLKTWPLTQARPFLEELAKQGSSPSTKTSFQSSITHAICASQNYQAAYQYLQKAFEENRAKNQDGFIDNSLINCANQLFKMDCETNLKGALSFLMTPKNFLSFSPSTFENSWINIGHELMKKGETQTYASALHSLPVEKREHINLKVMYEFLSEQNRFRECLNLINRSQIVEKTRYYMRLLAICLDPKNKLTYLKEAREILTLMDPKEGSWRYGSERIFSYLLEAHTSDTILEAWTWTLEARNQLETHEYNNRIATCLMAFLSLGDFPRALSCLPHLSQENGWKAKAIEEIISAYLNHRSIKEAIAFAQENKAHCPHVGHILFNYFDRASKLDQDEEPTQAHYTKILAWFEVFVSLEDFTHAISCFSLLPQEGGWKPKAIEKVIAAYLDQGLIQEAIAFAQDNFVHHPASGRLFFDHVDKLAGKKQFEAAYQIMRQIPWEEWRTAAEKRITELSQMDIDNWFT